MEIIVRRYFSCILDEIYLYRTIRYVEQNPVRARIVDDAWDYKWSSARTHVGIETDSIIPLKKTFNMDTEEWKQYLKEVDEEANKEMRLKTKRGLVVGTEAFIKKLEKRLKRSLKCLDPGRPKKGSRPPYEATS